MLRLLPLRCSLGADLASFSTDGPMLGMSGAAMGKSQTLGIGVHASRAAFCYSSVNGVYLEISLHSSTVTPDVEANEK